MQIIAGFRSEDRQGSAKAVADASWKFIDLVIAHNKRNLAREFELRAGVHCGSISAGVVGKIKPRFSLFGEALRVAMYLEASSRTTFEVHCSSNAKTCLEAGNYDAYTFVTGEEMTVSNQNLSTYYIVKSEVRSS